VSAALEDGAEPHRHPLSVIARFKRAIQYTATSRFNRERFGILDPPVAHAPGDDDGGVSDAP